MILVVDDYEPTRHALVRGLNYDGYPAVGVPDGKSALAFLTTNTPSLLILDYDMPGMDGLELLSQIRAHKALQQIPVIFFSANGGPVARHALEAGASAFVRKGSLDWAELRRQVLRVIGAGLSERGGPEIDSPCARDAG